MAIALGHSHGEQIGILRGCSLKFMTACHFRSVAILDCMLVDTRSIDSANLLDAIGKRNGSTRKQGNGFALSAGKNTKDNSNRGGKLH